MKNDGTTIKCYRTGRRRRDRGCCHVLIQLCLFLTWSSTSTTEAAAAWVAFTSPFLSASQSVRARYKRFFENGPTLSSSSSSSPLGRVALSPLMLAKKGGQQQEKRQQRRRDRKEKRANGNINKGSAMGDGGHKDDSASGGHDHAVIEKEEDKKHSRSSVQKKNNMDVISRLIASAEDPDGAVVVGSVGGGVASLGVRAAELPKTISTSSSSTSSSPTRSSSSSHVSDSPDDMDHHHHHRPENKNNDDWLQDIWNQEDYPDEQASILHDDDALLVDDEPSQPVIAIPPAAGGAAADDSVNDETAIKFSTGSRGGTRSSSSDLPAWVFTPSAFSKSKSSRNSDHVVNNKNSYVSLSPATRMKNPPPLTTTTTTTSSSPSAVPAWVTGGGATLSSSSPPSAVPAWVTGGGTASASSPPSALPAWVTGSGGAFSSAKKNDKETGNSDHAVYGWTSPAPLVSEWMTMHQQPVSPVADAVAAAPPPPPPLLNHVDPSSSTLQPLAKAAYSSSSSTTITTATGDQAEKETATTTSSTTSGSTAQLETTTMMQSAFSRSKERRDLAGAAAAVGQDVMPAKNRMAASSPMAAPPQQRWAPVSVSTSSSAVPDWVRNFQLPDVDVSPPAASDQISSSSAFGSRSSMSSHPKDPLPTIRADSTSPEAARGTSSSLGSPPTSIPLPNSASTSAAAAPRVVAPPPPQGGDATAADSSSATKKTASNSVLPAWVASFQHPNDDDTAAAAAAPEKTISSVFGKRSNNNMPQDSFGHIASYFASRPLPQSSIPPPTANKSNSLPAWVTNFQLAEDTAAALTKAIGSVFAKRPMNPNNIVTDRAVFGPDTSVFGSRSINPPNPETAISGPRIAPQVATSQPPPDDSVPNEMAADEFGVSWPANPLAEGGAMPEPMAAAPVEATGGDATLENEEITFTYPAWRMSTSRENSPPLVTPALFPNHMTATPQQPAPVAPTDNSPFEGFHFRTIPESSDVAETEFASSVSPSTENPDAVFIPMMDWQSSSAAAMETSTDGVPGWELGSHETESPAVNAPEYSSSGTQPPEPMIAWRASPEEAVDTFTDSVPAWELGSHESESPAVTAPEYSSSDTHPPEPMIAWQTSPEVAVDTFTSSLPVCQLGSLETEVTAPEYVSPPWPSPENVEHDFDPMVAWQASPESAETIPDSSAAWEQLGLTVTESLDSSAPESVSPVSPWQASPTVSTDTLSDSSTAWEQLGSTVAESTDTTAPELVEPISPSPENSNDAFNPMVAWQASSAEDVKTIPDHSPAWELPGFTVTASPDADANASESVSSTAPSPESPHDAFNPLVAVPDSWPSWETGSTATESSRAVSAPEFAPSSLENDTFNPMVAWQTSSSAESMETVPDSLPAWEVSSTEAESSRDFSAPEYVPSAPAWQTSPAAASVEPLPDSLSAWEVGPALTESSPDVAWSTQNRNDLVQPSNPWQTSSAVEPAMSNSEETLVVPQQPTSDENPATDDEETQRLHRQTLSEWHTSTLDELRQQSQSRTTALALEEEAQLQELVDFHTRQLLSVRLAMIKDREVEERKWQSSSSPGDADTGSNGGDLGVILPLEERTLQATAVAVIAAADKVDIASVIGSGSKVRTNVESTESSVMALPNYSSREQDIEKTTQKMIRALQKQKGLAAFKVNGSSDSSKNNNNSWFKYDMEPKKTQTAFSIEGNLFAKFPFSRQESSQSSGSPSTDDLPNHQQEPNNKAFLAAESLQKALHMFQLATMNKSKNQDTSVTATTEPETENMDDEVTQRQNSSSQQQVVKQTEFKQQPPPQQSPPTRSASASSVSLPNISPDLVRQLVSPLSFFSKSDTAAKKTPIDNRTTRAISEESTIAENAAPLTPTTSELSDDALPRDTADEFGRSLSAALAEDGTESESTAAPVDARSKEIVTLHSASSGRTSFTSVESVTSAATAKSVKTWAAKTRSDSHAKPEVAVRGVARRDKDAAVRGNNAAIYKKAETEGIMAAKEQNYKSTPKKAQKTSVFARRFATQEAQRQPPRKEQKKPDKPAAATMKSEKKAPGDETEIVEEARKALNQMSVGTTQQPAKQIESKQQQQQQQVEEHQLENSPAAMWQQEAKPVSDTGPLSSSPSWAVADSGATILVSEKNESIAATRLDNGEMNKVPSTASLLPSLADLTNAAVVAMPRNWAVVREWEDQREQPRHLAALRTWTVVNSALPPPVGADRDRPFKSSPSTVSGLPRNWASASEWATQSALPRNWASIRQWAIENNVVAVAPSMDERDQRIPDASVTVIGGQSDNADARENSSFPVSTIATVTAPMPSVPEAAKAEREESKREAQVDGVKPTRARKRASSSARSSFFNTPFNVKATAPKPPTAPVVHQESLPTTAPERASYVDGSSSSKTAPERPISEPVAASYVAGTSASSTAPERPMSKPVAASYVDGSSSSKTTPERPISKPGAASYVAGASASTMAPERPMSKPFAASYVDGSYQSKSTISLATVSKDLAVRPSISDLDRGDIVAADRAVPNSALELIPMIDQIAGAFLQAQVVLISNDSAQRVVIETRADISASFLWIAGLKKAVFEQRRVDSLAKEWAERNKDFEPVYTSPAIFKGADRLAVEWSNRNKDRETYFQVPLTLTASYDQLAREWDERNRVSERGERWQDTSPPQIFSRSRDDSKATSGVFKHTHPPSSQHRRSSQSLSRPTGLGLIFAKLSALQDACVTKLQGSFIDRLTKSSPNNRVTVPAVKDPEKMKVPPPSSKPVDDASLSTHVSSNTLVIDRLAEEWKARNREQPSIPNREMTTGSFASSTPATLTAPSEPAKGSNLSGRNKFETLDIDQLAKEWTARNRAKSDTPTPSLAVTSGKTFTSPLMVNALNTAAPELSSSVASGPTKASDESSSISTATIENLAKEWASINREMENVSSIFDSAMAALKSSYSTPPPIQPEMKSKPISSPGPPPATSSMEEMSKAWANRNRDVPQGRAGIKSQISTSLPSPSASPLIVTSSLPADTAPKDTSAGESLTVSPMDQLTTHNGKSAGIQSLPPPTLKPKASYGRSMDRLAEEWTKRNRDEPSDLADRSTFKPMASTMSTATTSVPKPKPVASPPATPKSTEHRWANRNRFWASERHGKQGGASVMPDISKGVVVFPSGPLDLAAAFPKTTLALKGLASRLDRLEERLDELLRRKGLIPLVSLTASTPFVLSSNPREGLDQLAGRLRGLAKRFDLTEESTTTLPSQSPPPPTPTPPEPDKSP